MMDGIIIPKKQTLRVDEAADLLGCSKEHVRRLIEEGSLQAVNIQCKGAAKPTHRVLQTSVVQFVNER